MSRAASRRRYRAGAAQFEAANRMLPRSHEIVRQVFEDARNLNYLVQARPFEPVYQAPLRRAQGVVRFSRLPLAKQRAQPALRARSVTSLMRVLRIKAPSRALFCLQRKARREVLHAFRIAGRRGIGRGVRVRRRVESLYSC